MNHRAQRTFINHALRFTRHTHHRSCYLFNRSLRWARSALAPHLDTATLMDMYLRFVRLAWHAYHMQQAYRARVYRMDSLPQVGLAAPQRASAAPLGAGLKFGMAAARCCGTLITLRSYSAHALLG